VSRHRRSPPDRIDPELVHQRHEDRVVIIMMELTSMKQPRIVVMISIRMKMAMGVAMGSPGVKSTRLLLAPVKAMIWLKAADP